MFPFIYTNVVWFQFLYRINAAFCLSSKFVPYRGTTKIYPIASITASITSSTTLADTGVTYTLKADTLYRVTGWARYGTKNPEEVAVTYDNDARVAYESFPTTSTNGMVSATGIVLAGGNGTNIKLKAKFGGAAADHKVGLLIEEIS